MLDTGTGGSVSAMCRFLHSAVTMAMGRAMRGGSAKRRLSRSFRTTLAATQRSGWRLVEGCSELVQVFQRLREPRAAELAYFGLNFIQRFTLGLIAPLLPLAQRCRQFLGSGVMYERSCRARDRAILIVKILVQVCGEKLSQ